MVKISEYRSLLEYLAGLIKGSEYEGHVYAVGGCVRDSYIASLNNVTGFIKDIDLVVDLPNGGINLAKYLESVHMVKGSLVIYETFGTVMFHLKEYPDIELEAVQTRSECYRDENSRNPETSYGTIQQDAFRRDFTINALYYNISTGEIKDFNGHGIEDIKNHIIDTCGDPDIIFNEDPLRIMRAIRFAARLGYFISERTMEGIKKYANRLHIISQERITDEFNKILATDKPQWGLMKLIDYGIIDVIMPEVKTAIADNSLLIIMGRCSYDLDEINAESGKKGELEFDKKIAMLSLISRYAGPQVFSEVMKTMKYSNDDIKEVAFYGQALIDMQNAEDSRKLSDLRRIEYSCLNTITYARLYFLYKEITRHVPWSDMGLTVKHPMIGYALPVDGESIMKEFGFKPGPVIGLSLKECLEYAFNKPDATKEELLHFLHTLFTNDKN